MLANQNVVVFDLETVPDIAAGRLALGLAGDAPDAEVRSALDEAYRKEGQTAKQVFIKAALHRIVCIGAIYAERQDRGHPWSITRAGAVHIGQRTERELIVAFLDSLADTPSPQLIGFNSSSFDLPVLRYRAIALSIPASIIHGGNGRDYWYRFGRDHLDLCDVISGFGATTRPSLAELGALCGISVKADGFDGAQVEPMTFAGRLDEVAAYCESDVVTTYLIYLRFSFVVGDLDCANYDHSLEDIRRFIEDRRERRPHLLRFIELLTPRSDVGILRPSASQDAAP
jgi:predicted PolB exonuclease-like 3'-5' exonuclease